MIVLRIQSRGRQRDVRSTKARIVLGSGPGADIGESDVGWAAEEAVLVHRGTEVELHGPHDLRLRVGDSVRIGHARVSLIGILPLEAEQGAPDSDDVTASSEAAPASPQDHAPLADATGPTYGGTPTDGPSTAGRGTAPGSLPDGAASNAPPRAAEGVLFGGYEEDTPGLERRTFELDDAPPPRAPGARPRPQPRKPAPTGATKPTPPPVPPPASSPARQAARPPSTGRAAPPQKPPAARDAARTTAAAAAAATTPSDAGRQTKATTRPKGQVPLPRPPAPAFRQADFGEELVRQLKRTPFFALSVAVHVLAFLVFTIVQTSLQAGSEEGEGGTLRASMHLPADVLDVRDDDLDAPPEVAQPLLPEFAAPVLPDEADRLHDSQPQSGDTLEALPDEEPAPFATGLNPSLSSVMAKTGRSRTRLARAVLRQEFAKGEAQVSNEKAAEYVRADLGRGTGRRGDPLADLVIGDLLVVDGTFDKIGRVLHALRLPYLNVPPRSMALPKAPDLRKHKVIFWNCGESLAADEMLVAARRLRAFVEGGGYLFTTDWAISSVVQLAFPGYIGSSGPRAPLPEAVVTIEPARRQSNHPLLKGVFQTGVQGRWWLEQDSFDIKVLKPREVDVLIESPELEERWRRPKAIAVTFRRGRGRVLHVMGHYYQEAGNIAGTISAHRLALNFVLERLAKD